MTGTGSSVCAVFVYLPFPASCARDLQTRAETPQTSSGFLYIYNVYNIMLETQNIRMNNHLLSAMQLSLAGMQQGRSHLSYATSGSAP